MDAIEPLIDNIVRTRPDDLPAAAVDGLRKSILDAFGTTLAGSKSPGVAPLLQLLKHWAGRDEATVALFGYKMPAHHAILANVVMCHALEIDDSHYPAIVHPTAPTLWTGLATAELMSGSHGEEFLCAVALGIDTMARIALGAPATLDNGYHTAIYSGFGAAVTAAKLLKVDRRVLHDALGITFARAAASVQAGTDGALIKRFQPAFNASEGLKAVLLAQVGITGVRNVMEGQFGVARLFNHAPLDRTAMLDGLGTRYLSAELTTKRYPTSRCAHGPIEGTLELVRRHDISADHVIEVQVAVQESCHNREAKPFDPSEGTPQVKAQFSIDYCVAAALLWRDVFISEMTDEKILDPRVLKLTRLVRVIRNPVVGPTQYLPVHVSIKTEKGTFETDVTVLKGSPEAPLSWNEVLSERIGRCVPHSAVPIDAGRIAELVHDCRNLDQMADVRNLLKLITPQTVST
jgi:2-methylcitrate dehydratase PrpD